MTKHRTTELLEMPQRQTERGEWNGSAELDRDERYLGRRRNWPGLRFWPLPPPRQLPNPRRSAVGVLGRWDDDEANDQGGRGKKKPRGRPASPLF
nr:unnamed protein product [Digitaria exilis]